MKTTSTDRTFTEKELSELYLQHFGVNPEIVTKLPGAGGNRRYYRLVSERGHAIGVIGTSRDENKRFITLSEEFRQLGANVPTIYAKGDSGLTYLQQDLGDTSLFDLIMQDKKRDPALKADTPETLRHLISESFRQLVKVQSLPISFSATRFRRQVMWDLNYFKYEFLKPAGVEFDEDKLEDDLVRFADRLSSIPQDRLGFMYRDFQSRNIMVSDGRPYLIDYQGGHPGPVLYDAISFLYQAKAGFPEEFRKEMLEEYATIHCQENGTGPDALLSDAEGLILFRTLQVLGAYGFRGLVERKAHFVESIPAALKNLSAITEGGVLSSYPELRKCCIKLCESGRFQPVTIAGKLVVEVVSFSYKKGYPENFTGNGGGFMFDCRGMHNPGRYDQYKTQTGLDRDVIDFLEERGEVQPFLQRAFDLTLPTVRRYIQRGFSHLQIGFGCTGGQHRSVYCAQHYAEMIREACPEVVIRLIHREQDISSLA